jgi:DNA topoisomerase-1
VSEQPAGRGALRHSTDAKPGIGRRRAGRGFTYRGPDGRPIRDPASIARIKALAVPPAWTDVWICPFPDGHLQATGRDARGRKQYRYHTGFTRRRDKAKFERLVTFAAALPRIRAQVDADLARPGLDRDKVLAAVVRLLELTLIRVGNDEYARLNRSFGLTTLRGRHATVRGGAVRFRFTGKSGRVHEVDLRDRRLATIVRRCQDLPGQDLFQFVGEDGKPVDISSGDVNDYLGAIAPGVTAKEFRTWAGTVIAYRALTALDRPGTEREASRNVAAAIRDTAELLGNTPAVCRNAYVHPIVVKAYLDGRLRRVRAPEGGGNSPGRTSPAEERAVLRLLRRRLAADARRVSRSS